MLDKRDENVGYLCGAAASQLAYTLSRPRLSRLGSGKSAEAARIALGERRTSN